MYKILLGLCISILYSSCTQAQSPEKLHTEFCTEYRALGIPQFAYDYTEYFQSIPQEIALDQQEEFFTKYKNKLPEVYSKKLSLKEKIAADHLSYEVDFNMWRISLERAWIKAGRHIPENGLSSLPDHSDWYRFFVKRYSGIEKTSEQVAQTGKELLAVAEEEIGFIKSDLGFTNDNEFYTHLNSEDFFYTSEDSILEAFKTADRTARMHLKQWTGDHQPERIDAMQWPNAGPNTPPGIYLNKADNSFGKSVFQYNFSTGKYNKRAIDWLYMHEAIPGHHLQSEWRTATGSNGLQDLFIYPGTFEGWACFVEFFGDTLGLYTDIYRRLGHWEWDQVRAIRLIMDANIHDKGWTHDQVLKFWKETLLNQDDIAERETIRVTNWPGQALSYIIGAVAILELREMIMNKFPEKYNLVIFNKTYLSFGMRPMEVIQNNFEEAYLQNL